jgi:hypothetical protein
MMAKVNKREHLLKTVCKNIINNPRRVDADAVAAFRKAVLRYADLQHITPENLYQSDGEVGVAVRRAFDVIDASNVLKELDDRERSSVTGAVYPRGDRWFLDVVRDDDDIDEREDDRDDDDEIEKKEQQPMESLTAILKDLGPVRLCEGICERQRAPCDELGLVAVLTKHVGDDRAFAKLYEAEESVRRACSIAKAAEFNVFDIRPVVVGGEAARDVDNATAAVRAYEEIVRIGREKFPFLSADQQFARVFEDSNYTALAAQAHQRPGPTTIYAGPGSAAPGRGAYTKADPVPSADSAYAELQAKAAEYRKTHPELSEAQAFAAVYSDRSNIELAKRERQESAAR